MGELHASKHGGVRDSRAAKLFTRKQSPREVPDVRCTFSTLTLFSHTFSTLTVASFHDYSWHFRTLMLILFHDNKRPHTTWSAAAPAKWRHADSGRAELVPQ